jgi:hypothetical protein
MFSQIINIIIVCVILGIIFIPRMLIFEKSGWKLKTRIIIPTIIILVLMIVAIIYVVINN